MPNLAILAVCEKVIFDHTGVPSLISIFQRMNVVRTGAPFPDNALAPNNWAVFTLWQHSVEEIGTSFEQRIEVITPNGVKFAESQVSFLVTEQNDLQSKNSLMLTGIPISIEGPVSVNVWLVGREQEKNTFTFWIRYVDSLPFPPFGPSPSQAIE